MTSKTVICHENDPKWRQSILNNEPELFSFRHILDEEQGSDYRILMLIRRQLSFKIIRINPESVRGLWAAQQEELIFIRNQNTERKMFKIKFLVDAVNSIFHWLKATSSLHQFENEINPIYCSWIGRLIF